MAKDGQRALQLLAQGGPPIDVLVTDVIMPGMDGATLARQARALVPELRVVMMSGYTGELDVDLGAADQFLHKPFTPSQLSGVVRSALDSARV